MQQYKADLTDEIEPQINELLERAEKGLKALNRKESLLQTKVEAMSLLKFIIDTSTSRLRLPKRLNPGQYEHR